MYSVKIILSKFKEDKLTLDETVTLLTDLLTNKSTIPIKEGLDFSKWVKPPYYNT